MLAAQLKRGDLYLRLSTHTSLKIRVKTLKMKNLILLSLILKEHKLGDMWRTLVRFVV